MRRSLGISNEAHMAGMRAAAPGRYEYEVESAIEAVYLKNGAMKPGYESIVGSGPNGTVLHYNESSRKMDAGDLLLVDAAGSYQGYTGDITRTYPVNGTFTPRAAGDLRARPRRAGGRDQGGEGRQPDVGYHGGVRRRDQGTDCSGSG